MENTKKKIVKTSKYDIAGISESGSGQQRLYILNVYDVVPPVRKINRTN